LVVSAKQLIKDYKLRPFTGNDRNSRYFKAILEAFNRHDLDAIMEFFSDDCSFDSPRGPDPWGKRSIGKEQVRELLLVASQVFLMFIMVMTVIGCRKTGECLNGHSLAQQLQVFNLKVRGCDLWEISEW